MRNIHITMTRTELRRTITASSARDIAIVLLIPSIWGESMGMKAGYIQGASWLCAACALIAMTASLTLLWNSRSEKSKAELVQAAVIPVIMLATCVIAICLGLQIL